MHLKLKRGSLRSSIILAATNKTKKLCEENREVFSESIFLIQKKVSLISENPPTNYISKQFNNNNCHGQQIYQIGGGNN